MQKYAKRKRDYEKVSLVLRELKKIVESRGYIIESRHGDAVMKFEN